MPQFRGTMHFTDRDGIGWSESYWLQAGDHTGAANVMAPLRDRRLAMLIDTIHCVYTEVSNTDRVRDSRIVGLAGPTEEPGTYVPAAGSIPLATQVAILTVLEGDPAHKNRKFLHGLTSADVDGNRYTPTAGFTTAAAAYNAYLINNQFQVRVNRHPNPLPPPNFTSDYVAISIVQQTKIVTRRCGRPFGLPVGRRRVA